MIIITSFHDLTIMPDGISATVDVSIDNDSRSFPIFLSPTSADQQDNVKRSAVADQLYNFGITASVDDIWILT